MLSAIFHDRGGRADDPNFSVDLTRSTATFRTPEILYIILRNSYTSQGDPDSSFPYHTAQSTLNTIDIKLNKVFKNKNYFNSIQIKI